MQSKCYVSVIGGQRRRTIIRRVSKSSRNAIVGENRAGAACATAVSEPKLSKCHRTRERGAVNVESIRSYARTGGQRRRVRMELASQSCQNAIIRENGEAKAACENAESVEELSKCCRMRDPGAGSVC